MVFKLWRNYEILTRCFALAASQWSFAEGQAAGAEPMGIMGQLIFLGGFWLFFIFAVAPTKQTSKEHRNLILLCRQVMKWSPQVAWSAKSSK